MKHFIAAAAICLAAPAMAQDSFGPLMTPAELSQAQSDTENLLVVDIRTGDAYAAGHVEGAVNAPYGLFRGPAENPGQLVTEDTLTDVLRGIGATTDRPTIITYQGESVTDFGAAARVYWTLKSSGVSQLAILNGGIEAWEDAGMELTADVPDITASDIDVTFSDEWLATAQQVQQVIDGEDEALLLDARPESFWKGEQSHPAAASPGTLPQSKYFEHANWFSGGPTIIDASAAQSLADDKGLNEADQLISFCNTGHWAATNWFALSELAGIDNVKLFPESVVGWSNAGFEMANVPGRLETLIDQIKNTF